MGTDTRICQAVRNPANTSHEGCSPDSVCAQLPLFTAGTSNYYPYYGSYYGNNNPGGGGFSWIWLLFLLFILLPFLFGSNSGTADQVILLNATLTGGKTTIIMELTEPTCLDQTRYYFRLT